VSPSDEPRIAGAPLVDVDVEERRRRALYIAKVAEVRDAAIQRAAWRQTPRVKDAAATLDEVAVVTRRLKSVLDVTFAAVVAVFEEARDAKENKP